MVGNPDSKSIAEMIKKGNGKAELPTVQGGKLWAWMQEGKLMIKDGKGGIAMETIKAVHQSNGVIHMVDHALMHK